MQEVISASFVLTNVSDNFGVERSLIGNEDKGLRFGLDFNENAWVV